MKRAFLIASIVLGPLGLAACADNPMGPVAPGEAAYEPPPPEGGSFESRDFAWSQQPGSGSIVGTLAFRGGGEPFTCQGFDETLTPETVWSRHRMVILYGSANAAAVPVSVVRARGPAAPSGDLGRYVRKTRCDEANHFSFTGLPNGAWYVITVAKPTDRSNDGVAVTRRVETRGGPRSVTLY